jgi:chemotaxis protein MotA
MAFGTNTAQPVASPNAANSRPGRSAFDLATIIGISAAFLLIIAAVILGGSPGAFFDVPAIFIVLGGTFGVTTACFSLSDIGLAFRVVLRAIFHSANNSTEAAHRALLLAESARRKGLLTLQDHLTDFADSGLFQRGLEMVIDGSEGEEVERFMQQELEASVQRHQRTIGVLRKAAEVSPAMGLIGTLVGLVQMLGNLEDPSSIGPSMAVALLTTFYGAVLANLVFAPLAAKLERNSTDEQLINRLYVMTAGSVARQENPRRLEMLLNTVLPPGDRIVYFR